MPRAKNWPNQVDFTAALQNPQVCFGYGDLSRCQVPLAARGRPIMYTGNFATVYKVLLDGKELAVRCFIRPVTDQHHRYSELGTYLSATFPPYFVGFEFLENGILVRGNRYPLLKMDWINGERLDRFVNDALGDPERIRALLSEWRELLRNLRNLGIAHNELQHGNVLVTGDGLRLVDYDAVYLPSYDGQSSPESGHRNYQHPLRKPGDFGETSDNFPALVIYLSLLAVSVDPGLWKFHSNDNLILKSRDYQDPANSECFGTLKGSSDDGARLMAGYLEHYCSIPVDHVPIMETIIAAAQAGQVDAPLRVGHTDASVRLEQATPVSSAPAVPSPPSAAVNARAPIPAAPPPDAAPVPRNAGPAQASRGVHPAFGGRLSSTSRPRLATASAPSDLPAREPEDEPEAAAADVPEDDTTMNVAVPALHEASAASIAAPDPEEAAAASTVSVIISDGSKTDSADVAAILNTAASALAAAAAAMGESGGVQAVAVPAPVVVVLVERDSTTP